MGGILEIAQNYIYEFIIGVITLLIGLGVGILTKKILQRLLNELGLNRIMSKVNVTSDLERWIPAIISYLIYLITIVLFLDQLGIKSVVLYIILGGVLMLLILTFLVGLKDVIPNFVGWLIIQKKGNIKEGKHIEVREIAGRVERVGYLETEIKTERGDLLYVPNALFLKSKFQMKKD